MDTSDLIREHLRAARLEQYLRDAKAAGLAAEQVRNFVSAGLVMQARQLMASAAARECDRPCDHHEDDPCHDGCAPTWIGYGGARGGGKSHWGLGQVFCDDCARVPGLKFLYLRKVGKAGREAVQDLRRDVLHSTPHEYKVQEGVLIRRDNGSRVILGHFQTEKDIDNYLGLQYDGALIEEATQLTFRKVTDINTCVRTSKPGWRPRKYLTTNPGNIGHAWFKAMFIGPLRREAETTTRFIQATVRDNRFVNVGYRRQLEDLHGWQRRAWLDGDWEIAAGMYFTGWREEAHTRGNVEVQGSWDVWVSLDYGFTHFTVAYLLAQDGDGNVFAVDEHAARRTLVPDHCKALDAMLDRNGVAKRRLKGTFAGEDVFSTQSDGGTIAREYSENGWPLIPANTDRINGWAEVQRRLGDPGGVPPRTPTLFVSRSCPRLIECLPTMIHNPNRPEDVLKVDCDDEGNGGDDAADAIRYGVQAARKPSSTIAGPGTSAKPLPRDGPRRSQDDERNRRDEGRGGKRKMYGN
jgi:phage terminase large subunit